MRSPASLLSPPLVLTAIVLSLRFACSQFLKSNRTPTLCSRTSMCGVPRGEITSSVLHAHHAPHPRGCTSGDAHGVATACTQRAHDRTVASLIVARPPLTACVLLVSCYVTCGSPFSRRLPMQFFAKVRPPPVTSLTTMTTASDEARWAHPEPTSVRENGAS